MVKFALVSNLKATLRNRRGFFAAKAPSKIVLNNPSLYPFIEIGVSVSKVIDKINAFDWLDLADASTPEAFAAVVESVFNRFTFKYPAKYDEAIKTAFAYRFTEAVTELRESITEVSKSYNIDGAANAFSNEIVNRFYYINYWADKKNIPVNYNETSLEKRALFNLDTIILSILADKLSAFNQHEQNKKAFKK